MSRRTLTSDSSQRSCACIRSPSAPTLDTTSCFSRLSSSSKDIYIRCDRPSPHQSHSPSTKLLGSASPSRFTIPSSTSPPLHLSASLALAVPYISRSRNHLSPHSKRKGDRFILQLIPSLLMHFRSPIYPPIMLFYPPPSLRLSFLFHQFIWITCDRPDSCSILSFFFFLEELFSRHYFPFLFPVILDTFSISGRFSRLGDPHFCFAPRVLFLFVAVPASFCSFAFAKRFIYTTSKSTGMFSLVVYRSRMICQHGRAI